MESWKSLTKVSSESPLVEPQRECFVDVYSSWLLPFFDWSSPAINHVRLFASSRDIYDFTDLTTTSIILLISARLGNLYEDTYPNQVTLAQSGGHTVQPRSRRGCNSAKKQVMTEVSGGTTN